MLQSVGGDDDEVLALCSVCCVLQSVGDDDEVLAFCSVCCMFQSVGDDDGVLAISGFYPVGGGGGSFPPNVPTFPPKRNLGPCLCSVCCMFLRVRVGGDDDC